jgi:hypothetical protein
MWPVHHSPPILTSSNFPYQGPHLIRPVQAFYYISSIILLNLSSFLFSIGVLNPSVKNPPNVKAAQKYRAGEAIARRM